MYKQYIKWEIRVRHRRCARNLWKIVAPNTFAVVVHVNAGISRKMITNLYLSIQRFLVSLWLLLTMSIVSKFQVSLPYFNYKIWKKVFSFIKSFHFDFIECNVFVQLANHLNSILLSFQSVFRILFTFILWIESRCPRKPSTKVEWFMQKFQSHINCMHCIAFNLLLFVWNLSFLPNYIPFWISSFFN